MPERRLTQTSFNGGNLLELFFDSLIHFFLMVVVIGESAMDLPQTQVRMLPLNFFRIPMVSQMIEHNFYHFCLSPFEIRHTIACHVDMGIGCCKHSRLPVTQARRLG